MSHTRTHPFKRNSPKEKYEKDHIGVDGSNVDYSGVFCDTFDDAEIDLEFVKERVANSRSSYFKILQIFPTLSRNHSQLFYKFPQRLESLGK